MCIYYSAAVAVTCKKDVGMGLCMFNFVFYVITLPLHTAMPVYTLFEYFWHSHPYIFLLKCFFSDLYIHIYTQPGAHEPPKAEKERRTSIDMYYGLKHYSNTLYG